MGGIAGVHPLPAAALRRVQSCGPAGGAAVQHHGAAGAGLQPRGSGRARHGAGREPPHLEGVYQGVQQQFFA